MSNAFLLSTIKGTDPDAQTAGFESTDLDIALNLNLSVEAKHVGSVTLFDMHVKFHASIPRTGGTHGMPELSLPDCINSPNIRLCA